MRRLGPLAWISFSLMCLTISTVLAGDALVGLSSSSVISAVTYRQALCEALAVQYSNLAERKHTRTLQIGLDLLIERNSDILSAAIQLADSTTFAQAGDHRRHWVQPEDGHSTIDHIQVPILNGEAPWGTLQVAFRSAAEANNVWSFSHPWTRFLLFVALTGFVSYLLFMKRTLRQLDPSKVIPPRVKSALDALTQGVVMIDTRDFIVLANDTFCQAVGKPVTSLIGTDLSALGWTSAMSATVSVHPWTSAIMDKQPQADRSLLLGLPDGGTRKFIVNTVPIMDDASTVRGALVSFHDVTELDRANSQLKEANSGLESSRVQILEKNQELEATNTTLQVEMNERIKAQAEREELHQQLVKASRQAGMADVASSVLHNVGNVLNSINVSTDTLLKTLKKPMVGDVCRIASMFHEHQDNLDVFLTQDEKGKQIPLYLGLVAESLSGNHQTIQSEINSLVKKVEHIKQVIMSQQDIAHAGNIREAASVEDLMEQALLMGMPEPEKYGIRIVREYVHVQAIMTDRHHVLQILVNVITNAKNAMVEYPANSHCLTVRILLPPDRTGSVRLEVTDTGGGIKAENLSRLFAQGFTTRKAGHGLGLHSAAISAKNLGGALQARSDGEGRGATFMLDLPLTSVKAAA